MVNEFMNNGSKDVVKAAIMMSLTEQNGRKGALNPTVEKRDKNRSS